MNHPPKGHQIHVPRLQVIGITSIPEIQPGDKLGETIFEAAIDQGTPLTNRDIVTITQKVVSKAEGQLIDLKTIEPSALAHKLSRLSGKDPRLVELILKESRAVVRIDSARGIIITETHHGFVCANAGIDSSNIPGDGIVSLLPIDPDASARRIRKELEQVSGSNNLAILISDTFGRAWREGQVNFAIGAAGMEVIKDYRGTTDIHGNALKVTKIGIADELASTAELVMAKSIGVPVAIIRGYEFPPGIGKIGTLLRDQPDDLFR